MYVAFVIDAFARRIIGWRCGSSMTKQLVLDALEQAVWTRQRQGCSLDSVVAQTDRGSQYTATVVVGAGYGGSRHHRGLAPRVGESEAGVPGCAFGER